MTRASSQAGSACRVPHDPLGIEGCSHHTILTSDSARAVHLLVDVLGGGIISVAENEVLQTHSTYVSLGDAVFEYAEPWQQSPLMGRVAQNAPLDLYHTITWKVTDLDRAAEHLERNGVRIASRTEHTITSDPRDGFGVPWGFTTAVTEGDPRSRRSMPDSPERRT